MTYKAFLKANAGSEMTPQQLLDHKRMRSCLAIGESMRILILDQNRKHGELADELGFSQVSLSYYLNGRSKALNQTRVQQTINALGAKDVDDLHRQAEEAKPRVLFNPREMAWAIAEILEYKKWSRGYYAERLGYKLGYVSGFLCKHPEQLTLKNVRKTMELFEIEGQNLGDLYAMANQAREEMNRAYQETMAAAMAKKALRPSAQALHGVSVTSQPARGSEIAG